MRVKWGKPLPPDHPLFKRYTVGFFPAPRPSATGKSEEKKEEPPEPVVEEQKPVGETKTKSSRKTRAKKG